MRARREVFGVRELASAFSLQWEHKRRQVAALHTLRAVGAGHGFRVRAPPCAFAAYALCVSPPHVTQGGDPRNIGKGAETHGRGLEESRTTAGRVLWTADRQSSSDRSSGGVAAVQAVVSAGPNAVGRPGQAHCCARHRRPPRRPPGPVAEVGATAALRAFVCTANMLTPSVRDDQAAGRGPKRQHI